MARKKDWKGRIRWAPRRQVSSRNPWDEMERKAARDLARNRAEIEDTPRGTPAG